MLTCPASLVMHEATSLPTSSKVATMAFSRVVALTSVCGHDVCAALSSRPFGFRGRVLVYTPREPKAIEWQPRSHWWVCAVPPCREASRSSLPRFGPPPQPSVTWSSPGSTSAQRQSHLCVPRRHSHSFATGTRMATTASIVRRESTVRFGRQRPMRYVGRSKG